MKISLKATLSLLLAFSVIEAYAQSTLDQNSNWNLTGSNQTFTFSRFDSSLGSLTAVSLILNSSTVEGSLTATNNTGGTVNIDALRSRIQLSGTGFTVFSTTTTSLASTPSVSGGYALEDGDTQIFTLSATSLSGLPRTTLIGAGSFASYTGVGSTPNFIARLINTSSNDAIGDPSFLQSFSFTAPNTSVTLRYTYTPTAPVPEPGQVAASFLLLTGIGAFVWIKRRKACRQVTA